MEIDGTNNTHYSLIANQVMFQKNYIRPDVTSDHKYILIEKKNFLTL